MLLSIDWDCYSGCAEYVFDAPIWGTPDREHDRLEAWRVRAGRRGGSGPHPGGGWRVLDADFPLYPGWEALSRYAGRPAHVTLSHAQAHDWLHLYPGREVLNLDSHHDLYSGPVGQEGGDRARWRPGNWAGLGLASGLISRYTARYPDWHAALLVAEGYDLARTGAELETAVPGLLDRVRLERGPQLPPADQIEALLLVQSPSWSSPAHDAAFFGLAETLNAEPLGQLPMDRGARR